MIEKLGIKHLANRALIKYHYPSVYNKFNYDIYEATELFRELAHTFNYEIFNVYFKTGILPKDYKVSINDVNLRTYAPLYVLFFDDNVKFDTINTYLEAVKKLLKHGINLLFEKMGKDKVMELINIIKNAGYDVKYKHILGNAEMFLK
jgi:hypothetical protein